MASLSRSPRSWMMLARPQIHQKRLTSSRSFEAGLNTYRKSTLNLVDDMIESGSGFVSSSSIESELNILSERQGATPSRLGTSMSIEDGMSSLKGMSTPDKYERSAVEDIPLLESLSPSASHEEIVLDAKRCMQTGALVPDSIVFRLLKDRMSKVDCKQHGWLLDGFPRTLLQVDALEEAGLVPDVVVFLKVSDADVLDRLSYRRSDPKTGKIYNLKHKAPSCPIVTDRLVRRDDDCEPVIKSRLGSFYKSTASVLAKFREKDVAVLDVEAGNEFSQEEIFRKVRGAIIGHFISRRTVESAYSARPVRIALMGPPGCGKGTQAEQLRSSFGVVHISIGDLLRDMVARGS
ncbi:hypothetical protein NDN08_008356 [Rhodosorus marinus]|uniref:Adenylate kinase n=1 Tax=Rhodosorus marinus TaxID=101924 RepID=A0AAV8V072_9RHOD|nr:hypothetical protein NDN08_008356 [Rhodosorus marinus]